MRDKPVILGLITARGGSKRVPRKNINAFAGKPLLAWSIAAGSEAGVFDRFILTTDDRDITKIGRQYGVEVPFLRPAELASDTASSYSAVVHAVKWLRDNDSYEADWIILLEPSSPGRQPFHIREVADIITKQDGFDSLVGVSPIPGHFSHLKELERNADGIVTRVGDGADVRRLILRNQEVPVSYYINSAIYAFKTANLFDGTESCWGGNTYGYVMDEKYALDIDTPEEWAVAEFRMKRLLNKA